MSQALRFGNSPEMCREAIHVGFDMSSRPYVVLRPVMRDAAKTLAKAVGKFTKDYPNGPLPCPEVTLPPASVFVPPPPPHIFKQQPKKK